MHTTEHVLHIDKTCIVLAIGVLTTHVVELTKRDLGIEHQGHRIKSIRLELNAHAIELKTWKIGELHLKITAWN